MSRGRFSGAAVALVFLLAAAGCAPVQDNAGQPAANTNAATNTAPTTEVTDRGDTMPVTMPVLEALFYDEAFVGDVKTKLPLTDQQIEQLRTAAREARAALRETEADDEYAGTTSEARRHAEERIVGILGQEKAAQLFDVARERWAGGGVQPSTQPGSVPTDTRVVVNAPAYRMDVFENGKLIKTYKVGIGYPEFPLPTGQRTADTIIFNPTWTPPDEPWVEASSNVRPGETIEAGDKRNPLGPVKIPIGLPSLIHGGKAPSKLGTFASHGCVGLTTPQILDFTRLLARLGATELSDKEIEAYIDEKSETKNVKLNNPVPVELRYETITVEDGKLRVYRDVYDRNTNTEENLRSVLQAYRVNYEQLSEEERTRALDALREMSRDAKGRLDTPATNGNGNGNANANANANTSSRNASNRNSASVTRSVKGPKEVTVEIAALQGKGYPAPVELSSGGGQSTPSGSGRSGGRGRRS
jgi:lipoprotein-anchoring transpeptidase ErfK/SrfK